MKESNEKFAELADVDAHTFNRFVEYCYTKNYHATRTNAEDISDFEVEVDDSSIWCCCRKGHEPERSKGVWYCSRCHKRWSTVRNPGTIVAVGANLWNQFESEKFGSLDITHDDLRKQIGNMRPKDSVTAKVAEHARLFVFSDKYLVRSLKDLCIHKLHRDLVEYDVKTSGVAEIVDLLRYVYENTFDGGDGSGLRTLVITFAVCKAEELVDDDGFAGLMEGGGDVAVAFARTLVKRLV